MCRYIRISVSCFLLIFMGLNNLLAGGCEEILGYAYDKEEFVRNTSVYSSFSKFFCSNEYNSFSHARDAGVKVGVLIDNLPISFNGHDRSDDWSSYRRSMCEAVQSNFAGHDDIRSSVNKINSSVVDAWKWCIGQGGLRFWAEETSQDGSSFVVRTRYNVAGSVTFAVANGPIVFQPGRHVHCRGDVIEKGSTINSAGFLQNCTRDRQYDLTVTLSTSEGPGIIKLPARSRVNKCSVVVPQIKVFHGKSSLSNHPKVEVNVDPGYKIVGGGARANWTSAGSLLTSSYPETSRKWVATSKDHKSAEQTSIDAWAIAIHDPSNEWDVDYVTNTGIKSSKPFARATVRNGYTMTGGGARVNWDAAGNMLTASYPSDDVTWEAKSKDHEIISPASITVYAIGIKPVGQCVGQIFSNIFSGSNSKSEHHPSSSVTLPPKYTLTGCGSLNDWTAAGNLLTASYPSGERTCSSSGKDHIIPEQTIIKSYAIGVYTDSSGNTNR